MSIWGVDMKVLKYGAVWCSDCSFMMSRWQEIEKENPWLKTEYHDFDKDEEMVEKYKITKPPTFIFLNKEEKEFLRLHGKICIKELSDIISMTKNR